MSSPLTCHPEYNEGSKLSIMKKYIFFFLLLAAAAQAQQVAPLTVEKIMRDPKWMGTAPTNYRWSADSKTVFFSWNPENKERDQPYMTNVATNTPEVTDDKNIEKALGTTYTYNKDRSLGIYEKGGDIYLYNVKNKVETRLTNTLERETGARFLFNNEIVYQRGDNMFQLNLATNELKQLTNFIRGKSPASPERPVVSAQDSWLRTDQTELFDIIKKRNRASGRTGGFGGGAGGARGGFNANATPQRTIKAVYLDDKALSSILVSPDGRFVSYRITTPITTNHNIIVPNYVTASGYTEDIAGRTKVGETLTKSETFIYDAQKDSIYTVHTAKIPGIKDLPDYVKDYPKQLEERTKKNEDRNVSLLGPIWNEDGSNAVIVADAADNKDLWILKLDAATGDVSLLDRQRDEAWIGGPGVGGRSLGWIDNSRFYYQSEATGYSHLYVFNISTGEKKQLTSGKWEVQSLQLSKDKKTFYLSANKEHPGITHFYKISVEGGELTQLTSMKGGNEVTLSPDEKWVAINYSYMDNIAFVIVKKS